MSLDVRGFQKALKGWAEEVHADAVRGMLEKLDEVRPRGEERPDRDGPSLAESERVEEFGPLRTEIVYEAEHASYTDEGTPPHIIRGNPLLAFDWDGTFVIVASVNHPGTTGTRWWSDTMTDREWGRSLAEAADRITLR